MKPLKDMSRYDLIDEVQRLRSQIIKDSNQTFEKFHELITGLQEVTADERVRPDVRLGADIALQEVYRLRGFSFTPYSMEDVQA